MPSHTLYRLVNALVCVCVCMHMSGREEGYTPQACTHAIIENDFHIVLFTSGPVYPRCTLNRYLIPCLSATHPLF